VSFRPVKPREYGTTEEVVSRLLAEAGGVKRAAHLIGLSATQVYAYADPQEEDQIGFDDVRRLVEASGSLAPAEDLAALAGGFVTRVEASEEALGVLLARSAREHGAAMALIVERVGNAAELSQADRAELERDLDHEIRALVAARRKLEAGP
jgi:hypothetical protein